MQNLVNNFRDLDIELKSKDFYSKKDLEYEETQLVSPIKPPSHLIRYKYKSKNTHNYKFYNHNMDIISPTPIKKYRLNFKDEDIKRVTNNK